MSEIEKRLESLEDRIGTFLLRLDQIRCDIPSDACDRMLKLEEDVKSLKARGDGHWRDLVRHDRRIEELRKERPAAAPVEVRLKTETTAHLRKLLSRMYHLLRDERTFSYREMKALQKEMMEEAHRIDGARATSAGTFGEAVNSPAPGADPGAAQLQLRIALTLLMEAAAKAQVAPVEGLELDARMDDLRAAYSKAMDCYWRYCQIAPVRDANG